MLPSGYLQEKRSERTKQRAPPAGARLQGPMDSWNSKKVSVPGVLEQAKEAGEGHRSHIALRAIVGPLLSI